MSFNSLVESILLLEQPHMDLEVNGIPILFDPELETKDYKSAVELFRRIMSGERVTGKYNSFIHIPKGMEKDFVRALVKDRVSMNVIKLWLSTIGRKTNAPYTVGQFFKEAGMYNYIKESLDGTKLYRVSHYGLGISEKTSASSPEEARSNVFGRLLKGKKINKTDYKRFKESTAKEIRPLEEKKQMHCWKGYKKKGTKKLPSGKIVNNCVKE